MRMIDKLIVFLSLIFITPNLNGQRVDSTFGNNGISVIQFGLYPSYFEQMRILPDGKILTVSDNNQVLNPIMIARLNPDGTIDSSFAMNGFLRMSYGYQYCQTYDLKVVDNGSFLISGTANGISAIAKITSEGQVDSSFGVNGRVLYSFGSEVGSIFRTLQILENGDILAIGDAYNYDNSGFDMAVVRFTANGQVDSTFGNNGNVRVDIQSFSDFGECSALLPDGSMLIGGRANDANSNPHFAILKLDANGSPVSGFGNNGRVVQVISSNYMEVIEDLTVLDDLSILAGGSSGNDFALLKFDASGNLVTGFGNGGFSLVDYEDYQDKSFVLRRDAQNRILLGGYGSGASIGGLFHAAIARFNETGQPDFTFDNDGKWINTLGQNQTEIYGMEWVNDVQLLIAGSVITPEDQLVKPFVCRLILDNSTLIDSDIPTNEHAFLYPNPSSNQLFVPRAKQGELYKILNTAGNCVMKGRFMDKSLQLNALPDGIYWLEFESEGQKLNEKFILKR